MAYSAPHVWTVGESITAALLNSSLRDNLNSLRKLNDYATILYRSANQSIPNAAWTVVTWDAASDIYNGGSLHAATPTSLLVAAIQGWWELRLCFEFAANANGTREWKHDRPLYCERATSANTHRGSVSDTVFLGAAATVELNAFQGSGGALNLLGSASQNSTRVSWRFAGE